MFLSLMIFSILFLTNLQADSGQKSLAGFDPRVDVIAENYEAGPYLIYDCEERHWTCVLESYYKECEEKRAQDIHDKKVKLRCAPVGVLPTKKSCFQRQLFLTGQNQGIRFCIGEDWKQKEISF